MRRNVRALGRRAAALTTGTRNVSGNNYFFFDGSALLSDLRRFRQSDRRYATKRLNLVALVGWFAGYDLHHYHQGSYRRATFYFADGDARVKELVDFPDATQPGMIADIRIELCGKRVPKAERAARWLDENNAPSDVRESLHRSEKAVDTQICCDALQLAASNKLDRLFLYANDYDFLPLVKALRQLGCNANLIRLTADNVNQDLVGQCDGFNVISPHYYSELFGPVDELPPAQPPAADATG